jgi:hypothetical protein
MHDPVHEQLIEDFAAGDERALEREAEVARLLTTCDDCISHAYLVARQLAALRRAAGVEGAEPTRLALLLEHAMEQLAWRDAAITVEGAGDFAQPAWAASPERRRQQAVHDDKRPGVARRVLAILALLALAGLAGHWVWQSLPAEPVEHEPVLLATMLRVTTTPPTEEPPALRSAERELELGGADTLELALTLPAAATDIGVHAALAIRTPERLQLFRAHWAAGLAAVRAGGSHSAPLAPDANTESWGAVLAVEPGRATVVVPAWLFGKPPLNARLLVVLAPEPMSPEAIDALFNRTPGAPQFPSFRSDETRVLVKP